METVSKKLLQNLAIMKSARLAHHRIIPIHKKEISPIILQNCEYLSLDDNLQRKFLICQWCQQVFTNSYGNRRNIEKHLVEMHQVSEIQSCPSPVPGIKPDLKSLKVAPTKKPSKRARRTKSSKTSKFEEPPTPLFSPKILKKQDYSSKSKQESPFTFSIPEIKWPTYSLPEVEISEVKIKAGIDKSSELIGSSYTVTDPNGDVEVVTTGQVTPTAKTDMIHLKKPKARAPKKPKILDRDLLVTEKMCIAEPTLVI